MTRFEATNSSEAVVAADRSKVWAALTDPDLLPRLTPLLRHIEVVPGSDDVWRWELARVTIAGIGLAPCFTEQMRFEPERHFSYTHEPPPGSDEYAGADGVYDLSDVDEGTLLRIRITMHADLPLPRSARPAVNRVIGSMMARTGERFAANLLRHLGVAH